MSSVLMERPTSWSWPRGALPSPRTVQAAVLTVIVHAGALALLLANWTVPVPPAPRVSPLSMQFVSLPSPPVEPVVVPQDTPAPVPPPPISATPAPAVEPKPDPRIEQRRLEQAALARKRVEEHKREQQRRQQREQEREALARQQQQRAEEEQQRAIELQRQQAAAAEQARQAQAAASRQYLPIAKQAPAYPQRALDKGIEGECTVRYTVNAQGRVETPEVVGTCHPLFIRPSLAAAQSFRYQPRVIDGRAVAVPNVKNTFTYRIE